MYGVAFVFPSTGKFQGWANVEVERRAEFITREEAECFLLEEMIGHRGYSGNILAVREI